MSRPAAALAAGWTTCPHCGVRGFPSDATWLDDDLLLVTYAPVCGHLDPLSMVVAVDQMGTAAASCIAGTVQGRQCLNRRASGSVFCHVHDRARDRR